MFMPINDQKDFIRKMFKDVANLDVKFVDMNGNEIKDETIEEDKTNDK